METQNYSQRVAELDSQLTSIVNELLEINEQVFTNDSSNSDAVEDNLQDGLAILSRASSVLKIQAVIFEEEFNEDGISLDNAKVKKMLQLPFLNVSVKSN